MGWKGEATTGVGVFSEVWEEILRPVNWEFRNPNSETTKLQRVLLITQTQHNIRKQIEIEKILVTYGLRWMKVCESWLVKLCA